MKQIMSHDFAAVAAIMQRHCGADKAITLDQLAIEANMYLGSGKPDRRSVEIVLQTCKNDFPFIVVGSSKGMYVATDCDDLNHEIRSRLSRIQNIQIGITAIKRKAIELGWRREGEYFVESPKQQELELPL